MKKVLFPYGISNFAQLKKGGYVYVDKTAFLPVLEEETPFGVFLRPRRFGKSLFLSVLEYYYDVRHKADFSALFGDCYIGQYPTPFASTYRVLGFDFSGIDTATQESTYAGFVSKVKYAITGFMNKTGGFSEADINNIASVNSAESVLNAFFELYGSRHPEKIYLLIDEYDHFTNEILWRSVEEFKRSVSQNGYVRKFYEVLKRGTQQGVVERFFITGVSPITLDALTSGFNIVTHLTKSRELHDMMGFTEPEVQTQLDSVLAQPERQPEIMADLKRYYNGYGFNKHARKHLYNSDMVLYFLREFQKTQEYPDEMLDPNIMPDYGKLKRMFEVANWQKNVEVLETILQKGEISGTEIYQFSFEKTFGTDEFINFLYYMGNLTFAGEDMVGFPRYVIPNGVIAELYWQYYGNVLQQWADLPNEEDQVIPAVRQLAMGDEKPFFLLIQKLLEALSNRDFQKFNEKYVKGFMIAYAMQAGIFWITSERELSSGQYPDIEMAVRPGSGRQHYEYVFELKYLSAQEGARLEQAKAEAATQLRTYLRADQTLQGRKMLRAFAVVAVKDKLYWEEVV